MKQLLEDWQAQHSQQMPIFNITVLILGIELLKE